MVADGSRFTPDEMTREADATWRRDDVTVRLEVTEGRDGSIDVVLVADGVRYVEEVCLLSGRITPAPDGVVNHTWFDRWGLQPSTALFVRHGDRGAFAAYAHPFGRAEVDGDRVRLWYPSGLVVDGRFRSDPLVVGRYDHAGRPVRREAVRGRDGSGEQVADLVRFAGPLPCRGPRRRGAGARRRGCSLVMMIYFDAARAAPRTGRWSPIGVTPRGEPRMWRTEMWDMSMGPARRVPQDWQPTTPARDGGGRETPRDTAGHPEDDWTVDVSRHIRSYPWLPLF